MDTLTVTLDPDTFEALREQAGDHGVSVEQEARNLLADSLRPSTPAQPQRRLTEEELNALGVPLDEPFDLKTWSDKAWDAGLK